MKKISTSLLFWVAVAIACGIIFGQFMPEWMARLFVTFNSIFGSFLSFSIPLIIVGLVVPAIADLGRGAGRLLLITALIAYGSTIFSGFFTYFSCAAVFPSILPAGTMLTAMGNPEDFLLQPYFTIGMPPLMDVMTALLLAFITGLGLTLDKGMLLLDCFKNFKDIVTALIGKIIIPLLPLHIFGIFLNMTVSGQVATIISMFIRVIAVILVLHVLLLLMQFCIAGMASRRNPLPMLKTMLPAYATALGTQSSAATIPVTLKQAIKIGVREEIATFTVPLCATIHLAGSTMKIVACSMALMIMAGTEIGFGSYAGFIFMLGITMVAAPGVPGGAIMAALGVLESMLGFDQTMQALIIAVYVAIDSFGTACNVTGDGAIAVIVDRIARKTKVSGSSEAIFACGCFWGVQHLFSRQKGVLNTVVGYTGGREECPVYEDVKAHKTGHMEAVSVEYDPSVTDYTQLCRLFFEIHDPAQTDGQGPDIGPQYRSCIFFKDDRQYTIASEVIADLRSRGYEVNTLLLPATDFWPAEDYHQNYYDKTGGSPYCHVREKKF